MVIFILIRSILNVSVENEIRIDRYQLNESVLRGDT